MEDLDLTIEQLETWRDVDLIAEVLALQDELKATRKSKAHVEIENQRLRKERQEFYDGMVTAAEGRRECLIEISHLEQRVDVDEREIESLRHDLARRDARIESLESECKIRASWQRESSAAITAIGNVLHKFACEPDEAVYEIRKIIEEEADD